MPLFQGSCSRGGSACHGDPTVAIKNAPGGSRQYFGPQLDAGGLITSAANLQMIHDGFVGVKSWDLTTMNVVTAGDPRNSFLWYKIEGTQNTLDIQCAKGGQLGYCGLSMPNDTVMLIPQNQRDMICNWIEQGAPNN
jgi:hypothetical protein